MSENLVNIDLIRAEAKRRWLAEHRAQAGLLDRVERSVPWWLIIIAAVLFLLSAPHTAQTFGQLTPVLGWLAPLGVEFGLLYAAFRRKRARQQGERIPTALWALEVLLFVTAIIVNGAGSLAAVVNAVGIADLPTQAILERFGAFPATTQVALVLVPIAALIIPIGTGVSGEGLAVLVFERDHNADRIEAAWQAAEYDTLRRALFAAFAQAGYKPSEAKRQAASIAAGFAAGHAGTGGDTDGTAESKRAAALRLLRENPDWVHLSLRVLEMRTGINKNTWRAVKTEFANQGEHE